MNTDAVDLERGAIGKTNRDNFFTGLDFDPQKAVAITGLRHTTNVVAVDRTDADQVIYGTDGVDGLSTDRPGLILASTMADCLPLYFYDPVAKVVAIAHAGWRGVLNNMAGVMVEHLRDNYSEVQMSNLLVLIGPGLRPCHFEVQSDVEELFKEKYANHIDYRDGRIYIDLSGVVKSQLSHAGLIDNNIQDTGECTYDLADKYFSFRREHPVKPQSMVAFISLRDE